MNKTAIALACAAFAFAGAPVRADEGTRVPYGTTPTVTCAPLFVCTITLEPHDDVSAIAAGDTARWLVSQVRANDTPVILVKPKQAGLVTNLVVATSLHLYYVRLESRSDAGSGRIAFFSTPAPHTQYAARPPWSTPPPTHTPSPSPSPSAAPVVDASYRISGDQTLAPQSVYNDGEHTYLIYEKVPSELPVVLAVTPGGDQLVNFRFSNGVFIMDSVPQQIDLVLHAGTGKHNSGERRLHIYHVSP
ncbi:MAG TPA: TrbG/VirB9 family P-type conjugative transfer protein [Candidatus Baltobacteraceae bacterium]|jgi:type IV secretion system protein VirB9|nr:TrbG/VirB9 family P-type conjugative transfer protein [Candidatus Baltobacteraceae bacterium]